MPYLYAQWPPWNPWDGPQLQRSHSSDHCQVRSPERMMVGTVDLPQVQASMSLPLVKPMELPLPAPPVQEWESALVLLTASSSSSDDSAVPGSLPSSILEDLKAYQDFLQRVAASLPIKALLAEDQP